jgi:uncharacterized membrane protein YfcA
VQVTAATTQTMLLLTSSASSIVYAQMGDTPWDWAAVMLPMAFAATLAGQVGRDTAHTAAVAAAAVAALSIGHREPQSH